MLIDTVSGHLLHKLEQANAFESLPEFNKLISSMTTRIDHVQIKQDVTKYYRYGMFSHKWEKREPLFKEVIDKDIYELEESPMHNKLKMFCKIVRNDGLKWAWSDTCCINQEDPTVLQEALVSMFKWYEGSALTVVYLPDVPLRRLMDSIWNQRAWTLQEYHASKVVRFYNKDWTLYKNIDIPNHKNSLEILAEMEKATGILASALMALRPGPEDIREKLRLASTRQSTRVEDAAYSLFGIFSVSFSAVYGEGNQALGRLLAQVLMGSGDTSVLAWTGRSGGFNSCLPAQISVFNQPPTLHIPLARGTITGTPRNASLDLATVTRLFDRLYDLPIPFFVGKRMRLPCIVFKLGPLSVSQNRSERVFHAQAAVLGVVKIKTEVDLSRLDSLRLVHPWIDFLLDRQPVGSVIETIPEESAQSPLVDRLPPSFKTIPEEDTADQPFLIRRSSSVPGPSNTTPLPSRRRTLGLASRLGLSIGGRSTTRPHDTASLLPPSTLGQTDKQTQALRTIARLRQPFGALLLTPSPGSVSAYRRVAPESLITVQVEEVTPAILDKLIDSVRVLDVL